MSVKTHSENPLLGGTQMARKKRVEKYINKQSRDTNRDVIPLHKKTIPTILPRNVSQEDYLYQLADPENNIVFAVDPRYDWGKTHFFVRKWVLNHLWKEVKKVVITRPAVDAEQQRFLAGRLKRKNGLLD